MHHNLMQHYVLINLNRILFNKLLIVIEKIFTAVLTEWLMH